MIAAYILIQAESPGGAGRIGDSQRGRALRRRCAGGVREIDEPAKRVNSRVRALSGVTPKMSRPAVHR